MSKSVTFLTIVAVSAFALLAASGQAASTEQRSCLRLAYDAGLRHSDYNPGRTTIFVGTEGNDVFTGTAGSDLICGLGGDDSVVYDPASPALASGDVFLAGEGQDSVENLDGGSFYGESGDDRVESLYSGSFFGGPGFDCFVFRLAGTTVQDVEGPCPSP
jgi:hypothetical protein